MKKPFLHTRIRKQLELNLNTDEAAENLRRMGAIVDSQNPDTMPFELAQEDYHVEGLIERWQGTESRIRYEGEVTLKPFDQNLRNKTVVASGFALLIAAIFFITPWSIDFFGTNGFFGFYASHFFIAAIMVIPVLVGIFRLVSYDPLAKRRWEAQQALGAFAEAVEKIKNEAQS